MAGLKTSVYAVVEISPSESGTLASFELDALRYEALKISALDFTLIDNSPASTTQFKLYTQDDQVIAILKYQKEKEKFVADDFGYQLLSADEKFYIRPDLKWSDGSSLSLEEMIVSLERSCLGTHHSKLCGCQITLGKHRSIKFHFDRVPANFPGILSYVDFGI